MVYSFNFSALDSVGESFRFEKQMKEYGANHISHRDDGHSFRDVYELPSKGTVISRFYFNKTGLLMCPDIDGSLTFSGFNESSRDFKKLVQEIKTALRGE